MDPIKHTPGPWVVQHEDSTSQTLPYIVVDQGKGWKNEMVCALYDVIPGEGYDQDEYKAFDNAAANARLIAAAPDLLAALEALIASPEVTRALKSLRRPDGKAQSYSIGATDVALINAFEVVKKAKGE